MRGLAQASVSKSMARAIPEAPSGAVVCWGIPFKVERVILLKNKPVEESIGGLRTQWLIFMHTTDTEELEWNKHGLISPTRGRGRLGEHVADYIIEYADGTEVRQKIRRRHHIGMFRRNWGENCFQAVAQNKPHPLRPLHEQSSTLPWGRAETRATANDSGPWMNWLWAWENPHPNKEIVVLRFEPKSGTAIISAVSAGRASSLPLRWQRRQKAILKLPDGVKFDYNLDEKGLLRHIELDMGQIISAQPRKIYPYAEWAETYNNKVPSVSKNEIHIEYTAHPDALFHLDGGQTVLVSELLKGQQAGPLTAVTPANRRVTIRVVDKVSKRPVPVKLHVHGEAGEYLAPVDRHRIPNGSWFEDYCAEFQNEGKHCCVYIPGETVIDLPLGNIYLEVSKGFEIKPIRRVFNIRPETETITIAIEKVLPWRQHGWVTADTHVHFLSPSTAHLEGCAEGVNVINLLASQWGELMTNVGDFDGKTTFGSKQAGGDGEWLVRVGTENRQHVLGHISLLGYKGNIIAPMCSGGPNEAAIGDPVGVLMMEWARQCRVQGGLVVLPHFPNPRCENAADLISGAIDAIEMTSWGRLYNGIDPYSLSDYYRYLNCGYFVPAVGGTDKMRATTAVGTIRTYTKIAAGKEFTFETWMEGVKSGRTFVTYGPLMEFAVEGRPAGTWISMKPGGGTVDATWQLASVTVPMSRIDLIVNGEIRQSKSVNAYEDEGHWSLQVDKSSWVAILVRGHYEDKPEMIAAHSSPVMIKVEGSEFFSAADAITILEQIEGALVYLDTVGTRAEDETYRRMRLKLTSAYRKLHNELHKRGHYHEHTSSTDHSEHHK
ncbi:MAG: CehA/McbA family metallohydrolase [Candidatus Methylomirabilales bacterium]